MLCVLLLLGGCATKQSEVITEEKGTEVETETSATVNPEGMVPPEGFYGKVPPEGFGNMVPPDGFENMARPEDFGAMEDRNPMKDGFMTLQCDVEFSSSLDKSDFIGTNDFSINEDEYQNFPVLLGKNDVGTTRMLTSLTVTVEDGVVKIKNNGSEKYNIILSGEWEGGISIESEDSDIMVTLASSVISGTNTPAIALKGETTTYIKLMGESVISESADNAKKGILTSDGDVVFFGEGSVVFYGEKKHGLKVDGTVRIEGGDITIVLSESAQGNGISADDAFVMNGGKLTINAMGSVYGEESKGIKVNGREGENPKGWIEINGGEIYIESVGKGITAGFEADEDGETETTLDDPDPCVTINGGVVVVRTTGTPYEVSDDESLSPEGLEAKDKLIVNGGYVEISATDDALNAGSLIEINGGYVFAVSRGDDGLDSNGKISINGGTAVIIGAGGMGLGFDCDSDQNFSYTGGKVIGIGGGNNAPYTSTGISFSFDINSDSFALLSEDGSVVAAYTLPSSYGNRNVIVIDESIRKGVTYSVLSSCTIESEGDFNGLALGTVKVEGGETTYSALASDTISGYHYAMGGGMGGGRMGGFPGGGMDFSRMSQGDEGRMSGRNN
ncbi:MAG: carbohydrate-binding domain-containing protein [Candidatus Ornithospirochaeta sp.]